MNNKIIRLERILTIVFVLTVCIFMVIFAYKTSKSYIYESDHSWNATVSKNFAFSGKYMVSQPYEGIFHYTISTGVPVLLLQAMIYKIFGVSHFTSLLVVLVFGILLYVVSVLLIGKKTKLYLLGSILISVLLLMNFNFGYLLTKLYGEIPAIFFIMMALLFLYNVFETNSTNENRKLKDCFIAGVFLGLALITKLIMVFLIVSMLGVYIMDIIFFNNIKVKTLLLIICGIIFVIMIEYIFRLVQFNFSFSESFESIVKYFADMFRQSRWGVAWQVPDTSSISERVNNLYNLTNWKYISIAYVILPIIVYLFCLIFRKKENLLMIYVGICVSSIFIYYILFGTLAFYTKRVYPYSYLLNCYYIYFILVGVKLIINKEKINGMNKILLTFIIIICSIVFIKIFYIDSHYLYFALSNSFRDIRKREDECIEILKQLAPESKKVTLGQNTPLLYLYTDTKVNCTVGDDDFFSIFDNNNSDKVYLIFGSMDSPFKEKFNYLYTIGLDVQRINKIDINENSDIYGIYELRVKDKEKYRKWKARGNDEYVRDIEELSTN